MNPALLSPVPATTTAGTRPVSVKRLSRLRLHWFVIGTTFGVGMSLLLNFLASMLILTEQNPTLALKEPSSITTAEAGANNPQTTLTTNEKPFVSAARKEIATTTPAQPHPNYPLKLALKVNKGDTLLDMLVSNRVPVQDAHAVVSALKTKFNPGRLKVGQKISVTLARHETLGDKAAVQELAIKLPNLSTVELQRLQTGGFNVASAEETANAKTFRAFGKVRSSFLQAGADARIPAAAMQELIKAYSYDVDFQREIHPGDSIEVLMDRAPAKAGAGYSNTGATLRYAALTLRGKKYEIYRYSDGMGGKAWYDAKGNSIRKSLLRTPVDAARITSGFGMRTHPIMGYTKMHRGVDFGAPTGTPIMAAGDGVVQFKGWKAGYGNFVVIKHNGKYETAYGHISRFGNIAVGSRVKQGQVIAYVGMTGMATGPHLHYEVRENSTQVNPTAKQFNMASGLSGKQLAAFKAAKQTVQRELAQLTKPSSSTQLASR